MSLEIDPTKADESTLYRTFTTAVVPRPISWLSTYDPEGTDNIAPFSLFNIACLDPPLFMISHSRLPNGERKHTTKNILRTGEFVHNLVTDPLAEKMHHTSANLEERQSEFDVFDIEREESVTVTPPRVADAVVSFECSLHESIELGSHTLILGRIERIHVDESVITEGKIDINKLEVVGRLTAGRYTTTEPHRTYDMVMDIPFIDDSDT